MRVRYIPAVITLIAGTITSIISILYQNNIMKSLILLLAMLIIFYIIGIIARNIIVFAMNLPSKEQPNNDKGEFVEDSAMDETIIEQSADITER